MRVSVSPCPGKYMLVVVVVTTRMPFPANSEASVYIVVVFPPAPTSEMREPGGISMRSESTSHCLGHRAMLYYAHGYNPPRSLAQYLISSVHMEHFILFSLLNTIGDRCNLLRNI